MNMTPLQKVAFNAARVQVGGSVSVFCLIAEKEINCAVIDFGSRNGTWLVCHCGSSPMEIDWDWPNSRWTFTGN